MSYKPNVIHLPALHFSSLSSNTIAAVAFQMEPKFIETNVQVRAVEFASSFALKLREI